MFDSVAVGVTTSISPAVAPIGRVAVISVDETTTNVAAVPLKVTADARRQVVAKDNDGVASFARSLHRLTNGPKPIPNPLEMRKIVLTAVGSGKRAGKRWTKSPMSSYH